MVEPETVPYQLRADLVEVHLNNTTKGEVWVEIKFGSKSFKMPDVVFDLTLA
jgi:hypothetical protein